MTVEHLCDKINHINKRQYLHLTQSYNISNFSLNETDDAATVMSYAVHIHI